MKWLSLGKVNWGRHGNREYARISEFGIRYVKHEGASEGVWEEQWPSQSDRWHRFFFFFFYCGI